MSAAFQAHVRPDYDGVVDALEEEILRLGALKAAVEQGTPPWLTYEQRINALASRSIALQDTRPILEDYDRRIAGARYEARKAHNKAENAMDAAYRAVKFFGGFGLFGLLVCMIWVPTVWLPVGTGLFLATAASAAVLALRKRPGLYDAAVYASSVVTRLETERQAVLARAEAGIPSAEMPMTAVAERVPDPPQLRLVTRDEDDDEDDGLSDVEDADVVAVTRDDD